MYRAEKMKGRTVIIEGTEWLYFSGTSYLGLAYDANFRTFLQEGFERYGTNFGGSRRSNLQLPVFEAAEDLLAKMIGTEAVLTVSSGTMAGQLVVKTLQSQGRHLFFAPGIHPALDSAASQYEGSYKEWTRFILKKMQDPVGFSPVLALSSIDVLHAQKYELDWLHHLPDDMPITILIDDSHGFGVYGKNGLGIFPDLPKKENIQYIIVASLGKAYGIPGGFIASDRSLNTLLWEHPFFGGASPVVPAYLHALLHSKEIISQQYQQLQSNIQQFLSFPNVSAHFQSLTDYPVFFTADDRLAEHLAKDHILISSFPYPGPKDPVITRIVLSASHRKEDLEVLSNHLSFYNPPG